MSEYDEYFYPGSDTFPEEDHQIGHLRRYAGVVKKTDDNSSFPAEPENLDELNCKVCEQCEVGGLIDGNSLEEIMEKLMKSQFCLDVCEKCDEYNGIISSELTDLFASKEKNILDAKADIERPGWREKNKQRVSQMIQSSKADANSGFHVRRPSGGKRSPLILNLPSANTPPASLAPPEGKYTKTCSF